eukprot:scaffold640_cov166-Amphora_coffeaeformis.AAC.3
MNSSRRDLLLKEIEEIENERRSSLQKFEEWARHPDDHQETIAMNKEEWKRHMNTHFDQQIESKRNYIKQLSVKKRKREREDEVEGRAMVSRSREGGKSRAQHHHERKQHNRRRDYCTGPGERVSESSDESTTTPSRSCLHAHGVSNTTYHDNDDTDSFESTVSYDRESVVLGSDTQLDDHLESRVPRQEQDKIHKSKLTIAMQGFRTIQKPQATDCTNKSEKGGSESATAFDPEKVKFEGRKFRKGRCYRYEERIVGSNVNVIVGIRRFVSNRQAECVLIVPFKDTILGQEEDGVDFRADFKPSAHFQVYRHVSNLDLKNFGAKLKRIGSIPDWIYEPQTAGAWNSFGYFLDKSRERIKRQGKREEFRILELFAGAGGMHLGFHKSGFVTVGAVDNDKYALATLRKNCKSSTPTHLGDVTEYLAWHEEAENRTLQGRTDCIVVTPPCQGFSGANRLGGKHDEDHNDLSLTVIEAARIYQPPCLVFENVLGMWRRKHVHYLKNIVKELMKLDYQVRVTELRACHYGSAQIRPRMILFATHRSAPAPRIPPKTHGEGDDLLPFVTVEDALAGLEDGLDCNGNPLRNTGCATTSMQPGEHIKLQADGLAPAIRASSVPPLHYKHDRCISVRECATLQDFPTTFEFQGSLRQQYRQVGNAVPVELATKIAQAVREVLVYNYER